MKRILAVLIMLAGLASFCPARATRLDACQTTAGASMGSYGWVNVQCQGATSDVSSTNSVSESLSVLPTHWLVSVNGQCPSPYLPPGYDCPNGTYSSAPLVTNDFFASVASGLATSNGTALTFVSGLPFGMQGCGYSGGCLWNGQTILFNSHSYTIASVNSLTSITLTTSAGVVSTPSFYGGPSWGCTDTSQTYPSAMSVCWAAVTSGGTDAITTTGASNYSLSEAVEEIYNSNGLGSLDVSACTLPNCAFQYVNLPPEQTGFIETGTPSQNGELLIFTFQSGGGNLTNGTEELFPYPTPAGLTELIYPFTNETETLWLAAANAGVYSATWNFGGSAGAGNGIAYQVFGFTSSTSFPPAGAGLVNRGKTLTQGKTAMQ